MWHIIRFDPILQAVAAQAMYDGGYWQSTGIGRYATWFQYDSTGCRISLILIDHELQLVDEYDWLL